MVSYINFVTLKLLPTYLLTKSDLPKSMVIFFVNQMPSDNNPMKRVFWQKKGCFIVIWEYGQISEILIEETAI